MEDPNMDPTSASDLFLGHRLHNGGADISDLFLDIHFVGVDPDLGS